MTPISDKVIVITGAAGGFGQHIARQAAGLGARIVATDIDEAGAIALAEALAADGAAAVGMVGDVTSAASMQAVATAAVSRFGTLDCWVNNAGVMPLAFFSDHEQALEAWSRCIDINIKGVLHGMIAAYEPMMAAGRGHVVNLSSIYGNFPVVGAGVYGASKAAVNFLSESMRVETQGRIKVTTVKPTGVPATGLAQGIVNDAAVVGILGQNAAAYGQLMAGLQTGDTDPAYLDADAIEYAMLAPEQLAEQVVYVLNQPWGVSVGDITVRASGDGFIL
jgi:NADP-dependent 3-hydroxy acid dehydrogenase YdfG